MNTEIELKFIIKPTEIVKFNKHLLIQQYLQQQYQLKLENIYFDTPNLALKKKNYALRIRKYGNHILQTLKTDQKINNELHERQEWEYEIKTEQIYPNQFPAEIQKWLKPLINQLKPIFTTNFERKIWLIKLEDKTIIELALDQGQIKADDKTLPICEIELELKQGELESMLQFAQKLQQDIKLTPEKVSKAERGYELLEINEELAPF
ncbi:MAG: CYTH domain-containing protein [Gammaproteobacteria bacterium]|jgi:inorganic triphosphatase YgiF